MRGFPVEGSATSRFTGVQLVEDVRPKGARGGSTTTTVMKFSPNPRQTIVT